MRYTTEKIGKSANGKDIIILRRGKTEIARGTKTDYYESIIEHDKAERVAEAHVKKSLRKRG
jgi:hypothetical protein